MTPDEYLSKLLKQQTFAEDDQELRNLRRTWKEIEAKLRKHFSASNLSIRWAGSLSKGTMIKDSYDGDMACYFDEDEATSLQGIYENTEAALRVDYEVERKASALRVKDRSTKPMKGFAEDLHIDVVPGRFTDKKSGDVFLHRTTGEKERLKTNLQVHIDHIRNSGVTNAIRLIKLWKVRNGLSENAKTFVLELLVVKLLNNEKSAPLSSQVFAVLTEFAKHPDGLSVEDPANPNGNLLKPVLDSCRLELASAAQNTLWQNENNGWEAAFGIIDDTQDKKASLRSAAIHVTKPTRPWRP